MQKNNQIAATQIQKNEGEMLRSQSGQSLYSLEMEDMDQDYKKSINEQKRDHMLFASHAVSSNRLQKSSVLVKIKPDSPKFARGITSGFVQGDDDVVVKINESTELRERSTEMKEKSGDKQRGKLVTP